MQNFRGTFVNTNRDAWVEINLSNLEHNVLKIKDFLEKNTTKTPELFAVIKADAYGHGSLMCAPILEACGVDTFGVASIDEGIELRSHKIKKPILVLGASPLWAFENAIKKVFLTGYQRVYSLSIIPANISNISSVPAKIQSITSSVNSISSKSYTSPK